MHGAFSVSLEAMTIQLVLTCEQLINSVQTYCYKFYALNPLSDELVELTNSVQVQKETGLIFLFFKKKSDPSDMDEGRASKKTLPKLCVLDEQISVISWTSNNSEECLFFFRARCGNIKYLTAEAWSSNKLAVRHAYI
jgi:hypothetical protein